MTADLQALVSSLSSMGLRFYHRLIRTLTLPNNAAPNDSAIVLGPDLPPCMQGTYSAAIFFRPVGSQVGIDNNDAPLFFIAQKPGFGPPFPATGVDEGWLVYDPSIGHCSYIVVRQHVGQNAGGGGLAMSFQELYGAGPSTGGAFEVSGGFLHRYIGDSKIQYDSTVSINEAGTFNYDQTGNQTFWTGLLTQPVSGPRGLRAWIASQVNSAAIGAEAVVQTLPSMTFASARSYETIVGCQLTGSLASNTAVFRVRQTNILGAVLAATSIDMSSTIGNAENFLWRVILVRNSIQADLTDNLVITLQALAGTVTQIGGATQLRYAEVRDVGAFADYPNAKQI